MPRTGPELLKPELRHRLRHHLAPLLIRNFGRPSDDRRNLPGRTASSGRSSRLLRVNWFHRFSFIVEMAHRALDEIPISECLEDLSDEGPDGDMPLDDTEFLAIHANPRTAFNYFVHDDYSNPPGRDGVAVKSYQVTAMYWELTRLFGEPLDGPSENRQAPTEWILSFIVGPPIDEAAPPEQRETKQVRIGDLAEWFPEYSSAEQLRADKFSRLAWRITAEDEESALRVASLLTRWRRACMYE